MAKMVPQFRDRLARRPVGALLVAALSGASCHAQTPPAPVQPRADEADGGGQMVEPPDALGATCPPGTHAERIVAIDSQRECHLRGGRIARCSQTPVLVGLPMVFCKTDPERHWIYFSGIGTCVEGNPCTQEDWNAFRLATDRRISCPE